MPPPTHHAAPSRRTVLGAAAVLGGTAALGGSLWRAVAASAHGSEPPAVAAAAAEPGRKARSARAASADAYGGLRRPDGNGLRLPPGFTSRVIAQSGREVAGTSYVWHDAPDGGACFSHGSGWIYVCNSEIDDGGGGAGAVRFAADGSVTHAYSTLVGTSRNCAGGPTPWGTWLSCEEVARGYVYETSPLGRGVARRDAMGRFKHEAAAVDPVRRCVYLTEDEDDGCFYRFVPTMWPALDAGRLDVLCAGSGEKGRVSWQAVPDPSGAAAPTRHQVAAATRFDGGEGAVYAADTVWFTTKGDNRVWTLDAARGVLGLAYDDAMLRGPAPLKGVDNVTRASSGELFVAEDNGSMEICMISASGVVSSFLRMVGHGGSELTGPAFSPDGTRLYFSSQRGTGGGDGDGITYEVSGPFRR